MRKLYIDYGLLEEQIKALLDSNLKECFKTGLHTLLGEIADTEISDRIIKCIPVEK